MDAAWSVDDQPVVGIVDANADTGSSADADADGESLTDALRPTVATRDAATVAGDAERVLEATPSVLVAAGDDALSAIARAGTDVPVLPVGDVTGIDAVDRDRAAVALEAVLTGDATVRRHAILGLAVEPRGDDSDAGEDGSDVGEGGSDASEGDEPRYGTRERALFNVTLVTDEPARISEYGVSSRGDSVATFRADGVVVATPAGSHGYAAAVDAPHLSAAVDAVAVSPIAPFVTDTRRWVLPDDDVALTVERDEGDVALVVDDRRVTVIDTDARVTLSVDDALETLVVSDGALDDR